jgi:hypothetical protein
MTSSMKCRGTAAPAPGGTAACTGPRSRRAAATLELLGEQERAVHGVLARQVPLQREGVDRLESGVHFERLVGSAGEQIVEDETCLAEGIVGTGSQELPVVESTARRERAERPVVFLPPSTVAERFVGREQQPHLSSSPAVLGTDIGMNFLRPAAELPLDLLGGRVRRYAEYIVIIDHPGRRLKGACDASGRGVNRGPEPSL